MLYLYFVPFIGFQIKYDDDDDDDDFGGHAILIIDVQFVNNC